MSDEQMSCFSHLDELRRRILISLVGIGVGFVLTFSYSETVLYLLKRPLTTDLVFSRTYPFLQSVPRPGPPVDLIFLAPAEAFWMHMKIAFFMEPASGPATARSRLPVRGWRRCRYERRTASCSPITTPRAAHPPGRCRPS